jgi:hypothetical protein
MELYMAYSWDPMHFMGVKFQGQERFIDPRDDWSVLPDVQSQIDAVCKK